MAREISDLYLETLCHRAIADPHSITRDERNIISRLPPPEEEDRLSVEKTGHTRAELVSKALATPDEAAIVVLPHHVRSDTQGTTSSPAGDLEPRSNELQELCGQAEVALNRAASEGEKTARMNACNREIALRNAELEELDRRWEERLIKNGLLDAERWGFVVFRTAGYGTEQGEEAWRRFREYFDAAARATILHYNSGPLLWPHFRTIFVEREELSGASDEQLRIEFKKLRDGGTGANRQIPEGIRTSLFLAADRASIENDAVKTGFIARDPLDFSTHEDDPAVYIRAVHPEFRSREDLAKGEIDDDPISSHASPAKDGEVEGFAGAVKVALPRVLDWLNCVCFEAERGSAWEGLTLGHKGWYDIYTQTKVPEDWVREFAPNTGTVSYQIWPKRRR